MDDREYLDQRMAILRESIDSYESLIELVRLSEDDLRKYREQFERRRQQLMMDLAVEEKITYGTGD